MPWEGARIVILGKELIAQRFEDTKGWDSMKSLPERRKDI